MTYDASFFGKLVGYSCLAKELVSKFIEAPKQMFDEEGNPNPKYEEASAYEKRKRQDCCMFVESRSSVLMKNTYQT